MVAVEEGWKLGTSMESSRVDVKEKAWGLRE
jgi:hypothetical protein